MIDNDTKRLSRLIAILTQLQTKRLLTATTLAEKFGVSIRTIYRDIRALEQAGVPILTEDGKSYTLMEGYKTPPVMFTEIRERNSNNLSQLQNALTSFRLIKIDYTNEDNKTSNRLIEPFALLSTTENWLLVAWCRLRKDFRYFRLDRITKMEILSEKFAPHKLTLQKYFDKYY